jgi:hypothetical protein
MTAIVAAFPQLEVAVYHFQFPGTWEAVVQKEVNGIDCVGEPALFFFANPMGPTMTSSAARGQKSRSVAERHFAELSEGCSMSQSLRMAPR